MPGISGIIGKGDSKKKTSALRDMVDVMMHEPSYSSGKYVNEQLGLYIGWANRAESFSDCMPVWNETKDVCLIYYGENFADKSVTDRLRNRGHQIDPSNASYLVHLYEEDGPGFVEELNGWFCGVLIDLRKNAVMLFNDRYGMQRVYCHERDGCLYFGSEAKSILKVRPELRAFDPKSLGEVCNFGCVIENRSLFSGVSLLPPGALWHLGVDGIKKERYFDPSTWENQPPLEKEVFYNTFRETFVRILPKYFHNAKRLGLSLTGGLDTRLILSNMAFGPNQLPCYTFGGIYRDCFDVKIARKVAKICDQSHHVLKIEKRFFSDFPRLAEQTVYITDGNLDVTGAPDLYVNKMAKRIAPVRMTGNYGSEIMRGSRHLKPHACPPNLYDGTFGKYISAAAATLTGHLQDHRVTFAAFKQTPWLHHNRLALEQSQVTLRSPFLDNELVELMYRAPAETLDSSDLSLRLIREGNCALGRIMTDRGLGGDCGPLLSKAAHLYREFLFKTDYAFDYGMPQWYATLDHTVLAPFRLERYFLGRHKFYHFRVWYRDQLAAYVKDVLLDPRSLNRPYLNRPAVERMVLDHTSGRRNHTSHITDLLSLELLQRVMLDQR